MRNKITMEMSICQAENGFSLDELVKKFADAFENKAFADILKMNLQLKKWCHSMKQYINQAFMI